MELFGLGAILIIANASLIRGGPNVDLVLLPSKVLAGQWRSLFTHAFVHVSWLHFFFDGTAFLLLYGSLEESRPCLRLLYLVATGVGSLGFSLLFAPQIWSVGLCGLSGIDHGLMAVLGIEMAGKNDAATKNIGRVVFVAVFLKALIEVLTGAPMLEFLHFGQMGVPIVVCHLGGVVGGATAAFPRVFRTPFSIRKNAKKTECP